MMIFSSIQAAAREGFRWHYYNAEYRLHVVELDRMGRNGRRERAIAFARPTDQDDSSAR